MSDYNFDVDIRTRRGKDIDCSWCGMYVSKGELYATWGQIFDSSFSRLSMHHDCYHSGWKLWSDEFTPGNMKMGQPEYVDE